MIQRGSIVRLGSKWSKQEERHLLYGTKELYEDIGRYKINNVSASFLLLL